jgi:predicted permease
MLDVLIQTLPFFTLIGLGYLAGRTGFFTPEATAALTKFVFYFALSAMLLRFSANLNLRDVLDWPFVWAYLIGTSAVYLVATAVALIRKRGIEEAAVEAQCAAIGNTGFLGVPMLALLFGPEAIGPVMLVLAVDLVVFSSLIVILITGHRDGRISPRVLGTVALGLVKNPMIVSIVLGFAWSATGVPLPGPVNQALTLLGAAAIDGFSAKVMISAAALPVAGNVYILAQHYGVAPTRVSASILVSTALSIFTVSAVIAILG